jgi:hypothetical protein
MRALVLATILLASGLARAGEHADAVKLPLNPCAHARAGDWAIYDYTAFQDAEQKNVPPNVHAGVSFEVLSVSSATVVLLKKERFELPTKRTTEERIELPAEGMPTLATFLRIDATSQVENMATTDDDRAVAGHVFSCKKTSYMLPGGQDECIEETLWLSESVHGPGIVGVTDLLHTCCGKTRTELRLVAHGSAEHTDLGASGEHWKIPLNPAASATAGDWSVFVTREKAGAHVELWTIESVEGTTVKLSCGGRVVELDARVTPTLHALLGIEGPLEGLAEKDEKKTVSGREFACRRLDFTANGKKATLWMCDEVKGSRLVAMRIDTGEEIADFELAGFGNKAGAVWGKTAPELAK